MYSRTKRTRPSGCTVRRYSARCCSARALRVHSNPDHQREDIITLLTLVDDPDAMRPSVTQSERRWLRSIDSTLALDDPARPARFSLARLRAASAAYQILTATRARNGSSGGPSSMPSTSSTVTDDSSSPSPKRSRPAPTNWINVAVVPAFRVREPSSGGLGSTNRTLPMGLDEGLTSRMTAFSM